MVEAGIHPKDAQALARHSTITLTMDRYAHVRTSNLARALGTVPAWTTAPPAIRRKGSGSPKPFNRCNARATREEGLTQADGSGGVERRFGRTFNP